MKRIVFILLLITTLSYGQRYYNTEGDQVLPHVNSATSAMLAMPFDESAAMDSMRYFYTTWDTVASEDSLIFAFVTDDDTTHYLKLEVNATLGTVIELYESPTWSDSTAATSYNYEFNSSYSSPMVIATLIYDQISTPGTRKINMGFGTATGDIHYKSDRFALKADTQYMLVVFSNAANNVINIKIDWFDHVGIH